MRLDFGDIVPTLRFVIYDRLGRQPEHQFYSIPPAPVISHTIRRNHPLSGGRNMHVLEVALTGRQSRISPAHTNSDFGSAS